MIQRNAYFICYNFHRVVCVIINKCSFESFMCFGQGAICNIMHDTFSAYVLSELAASTGRL